MHWLKTFLEKRNLWKIEKERNRATRRAEAVRKSDEKSKINHRQFYKCVSCGADASQYKGWLLVGGPFARCEKCGRLWCQNCWRSACLCGGMIGDPRI